MKSDGYGPCCSQRLNDMVRMPEAHRPMRAVGGANDAEGASGFHPDDASWLASLDGDRAAHGVAS